jgi:hypothetical protein
MILVMSEQAKIVYNSGLAALAQIRLYLSNNLVSASLTKIVLKNTLVCQNKPPRE